MGGLHNISKKDWERLLKKNGFVLDRTTKHQIWKHPDGRTIPASSSSINPCVARRMVKENRLVGAPFGWSERAEKADAKAKSAEEKLEAWKEQLKVAQEKIDEENRQREAEEKERAQQLREEKIAEQKRREAERQQALQEEAEQKKRQKAEKKEAAAKPLPTEQAQDTITPKINLYMNEQRLKKFHDYLCAVVEFYQQNNSLKNFSALAKQYQVKAITLEQFYQSKLNELKPGQKPDRATSDKIRLMMAEDDLKRRQQMLDTFLKTQEQRDSDGDMTVELAEVKEPTLAERIDTFEARFDLLGPVFANITNKVFDEFQKEFGTQTHELLGLESNCVRLSPEPYLRDWANCIEFDLTKLVFDKADQEEVRQMLPSWNDKILHAYLTWLYGGNNGDQLKLHFDERGCADSSNEQLIDLLRDQQLLDDMLFVKLETWKGVALCAAIYKDAPDVLMVIGEDAVNFYTIEDNIWYSYCGDTIICPESNFSFGGWGTRTIMGHCLRQMLSADNRQAAINEQKNVTKQMRGKLMDDINHYRDIWQMYHEEYQQKQKNSMLDFG